MEFMEFMNMVIVFEHNMLIKGADDFIQVKSISQKVKSFIMSLDINRTNIIIYFFHYNTTLHVNMGYFSTCVYLLVVEAPQIARSLLPNMNFRLKYTYSSFADVNV